MSVPKWKSLQQAADRARKSADHEKAVELYSQALSRKAVPWEAIVELTLAYAYCLRML
jgi:hypothetical protein